MNVIRMAVSQNLKHASLLNPSKPLTQRLFKFYSAEVGTGTKPYFDDLVSKNKVVIFMKGTPDEPKCGFSNAVVQVLRMHGVQYDSHNVLDNEEMRQGIKEYSEWPTIPQIFMNGEFTGGCDILIQMHQNGEFIEELKKVGITSDLLKAQNKEGTDSKTKS